MIIDSHQHVFWHGRDDAGLVADMDEHHIDLAWLLTWEIAHEEDDPTCRHLLNPAHVRADGTHPGIPLSDLIHTRNRYPDRFVLGYCPHPLKGDAAAFFHAAYKIHNVRVCGEWKFRMLLDDPRCLNLFHKAGDLGCPVVLHLDVPYLMQGQPPQAAYQPQWYGGTVDNLERALIACPRTNFVGHAPGFWRHLSADAQADAAIYPTGPIVPGGRLYELLDRHPNLYADLSANSGRLALQRDPDHAGAFLTRYADRLLFGRDYYGNELMAFLQTLNLPDEVLAKITHLNAKRLLDQKS